MEFKRRDVLKVLSAAPFAGLFGSTQKVEAASSRKKDNEHAWRVFEEPFLSEIAFPLGGIGTGTFSIGGRGNLRDWELYNRPDKNRNLNNTFFGLWYKEEGKTSRAFVLESELKPPFRGGFGLNRGELPGMPRLRNARFMGSYPFARIEFSDDRVPLEISLEAFNPFIPLNEKDSGIPTGVFYWQLKNTSKKPIELTLMASMENIVGDKDHGKNINEYIDDDAFRGIYMRSHKFDKDDEKFGSMALLTQHKNVTYTCRWDRGGWFDAQSLFWNDFSDDGRLNAIDPSDPSPDRKTDTASLGAVLRLEPGEKATVPFIITWHFPNRKNYWNSDKEVKGQLVGNYYATQYSSAWDAAKYVVGNLYRLEQETRLFHKALYDCTVPDEVLDAVSSQSSIIRTNTCFRDQQGKFFAFEGCSDQGGCCPLNCTHVWNYEQTLAYLFPNMERTMRDTDFLFNTNDEGKMSFRTLIPLGKKRWEYHAAADGQMGCIIKLYREWLLSGDMVFLKKMWPKAKQALEFAWKDWDPDKNGVMEGQQHNTYDIEFYGPNPMMGAIYLTALRAAEKMALALGDHAAASEYKRMHENGSSVLDRQTWKGDYYVQVYNPEKHTKYQLGDGCLSDQLLGQWMAHVVDLGHVLPEEKVKKAVHSIYKYNFRETLSEHYNPQRIYALGDEAGLLLCSWPKGKRPALPFVYSDEVWTGIEYQVASHLIYEGFVKEGIDIVKAIRNRYDGERRNPWNEVECGHHYARALASWSVLLALSGYNYSAPEKMISFFPRINQKEFTGFWSNDAGWGSYNQQLSSRKLRADINIMYGRASLQKFSLPAPKSRKGYFEAEIIAGDNTYSVAAQRANDRAIVPLPEAINLGANESIHIELKA